MQPFTLKTMFRTAGLAVTVLLLTAGASRAAESVDLTARATTKTLPDGQTVPMWGLFCANPTSHVSCSATNHVCAGGTNDGTACSVDGDCTGGGTCTGLSTWAPVILRVPTGMLTINLTNSLPGSVPTSLMIVGQLGGGLGYPTKVDSPLHVQQGATWPVQGEATDPVFTPPDQPKRIQTFGQEVGHGPSVGLIWANLKEGTYLIESGTHPSIQGPMGLYGILIVSDSATAAYGVSIDKDVPLLLSEIDPVQNAAVKTAAETPGFSETAVRVLRNRVSSIALTTDDGGNVMNAGTGYSCGDAVTISGGGGTGATAQVSAVGSPGNCTGTGPIAEVEVLTPGDNYTSAPHVDATSGGSGALLSAAMILAGVRCSDGAGEAVACYPPAVNYDPRYYLINGVAFDGTNRPASTFDGPGATPASGTLLLRFVNAGLRMHVPSVVGLDMHLIAEDGNKLPGTPRIQNEVFLAAGKTYDISVSPSQTGGAYDARTYPVFDRQLSLSTNNQRDGGMQGYIKVNGGSPSPASANALAGDDNYFLVPGQTLKISDPAKGLLANDHNVYGVKIHVGSEPTGADTFKLNSDGTFTYVPASGTLSDSFVYEAANNPAVLATVNLNACTAACAGSAPTANADEYTSNIATLLQINPSGVLANDVSNDAYALKAELRTCVAESGFVCLASGQVTLNPDGSFIAHPPAGGDYNFTYRAVQSHGLPSADVNVKLHFLSASHLNVRVLDGPSTLPGRTPVEITDYRWLIEEDRTVHVDSASQVNVGTYVPNLGTSFHSSYMPLVAAGCVGSYSCEALQTVLDKSTGEHVPAVCDVGNGACRALMNAQQEAVDPGQVHLDPTKRYYISILPGDGANSVVNGGGGPMPVNPADPGGDQRPFSIALDCPTAADFAAGTGTCGHGMGGAPLAAAQPSVDIALVETPFPSAKISVFVFEDDNPLNGEVDAGGGVDVLATQEPGLAGFNIVLLDQAGGLGDSTGQPTYDMFNMPLSNSLAGTRDPLTGLDACPISPTSPGLCEGGPHPKDPCHRDTDCGTGGVCHHDGLVGMIVTCPKFESDGETLSPLAGQVVISNLYPGLYEVVATPAADRIARGEEWLQTNTLDGTKPHEAFIRPNEPAYFQEFGPAGYHVSIGFANPAVINDRLSGVCAGLASGQTCSHSVTGSISSARISRTPDQRIYGTGTYDAFSFTQCYVSLGDPGGQDFAFTKCDPDGNFAFSGLPPGNHKITVFDQWNDIIVDGLSLPVGVSESQPLVNMGELPMMQWRTNLATRTYFDKNGNGVSDADEPGLPLLATNVRYRDGSFMGFNNTDLDGYAGFNEIFPFFNWMVIEADSTRYKQTGVHVVYDAGGPADKTPGGANSEIAGNVANTKETVHLPPDLRVPGAVYCADADCSVQNLSTNPHGGGADGSTGRIDPAWVTTEGWQGFAGETQFFEFGKQPFAEGENGGIRGHVVYASTRPFDDPQLLLQLSWEPMVPHVTINLYQEKTAPDGTDGLTLVDATSTSSWDDWAQGFRKDASGNYVLAADHNPVPNMNCPGQDATSPFYFTLRNSPQQLNPGVTLPYNSQFKCYDGMAILNQVQPAPYDGMYQFPSVVARDTHTGLPTGSGSLNGVPGSVSGSNCTVCVPNPADGTPMLPAGKYVVEMILPPGYELVKEEDKNILLGDVYIAPVTQQFGGLGSIFIMPDQAEVDDEFNPDNPLNATNNEGVRPRHEGDTGSVEAFWPCVGQERVVPDFISLFPQAQQASPFAGALRHLCDRKEVTLEDQSTALAKFYVFTSTQVAGHFTGVVTNDFGSEFDPFSPNYGEKFAVPNLPISFKNITGQEVTRTYSDQWGFYNGLHYSNWEVNPPNPTGFGPQMAIACMNDAGRTPSGGVDPLYNPGYSQFCYEWSLMPGQTAYMDTPVVPTMAFADGYNPPDCAFPDKTPAIKKVTSSDVEGPWVQAIAGAVASVMLTEQGSGYTSNPSVSFGGPGSGAAATTDLKVRSITLNSPGNFYRSVPAVSFTGGGAGSGAAATADMKVSAVDVPTGARGSGYTSAPTVTFPGGTGGSFPVTLRVDSIVLSSPGAGYTSRPTATINSAGTGGSGAAAVNNGATSGTFLSVNAVVPSAGGSGYTSAPGLTISLPACTINGTTCIRAVVHANLTGGSVTSVTVDNPGAGYNSRPTVTIDNTGHGGTGVAFANSLSSGTFLNVNRVVLSAAGSGYTSRPTVTFSATPAPGTQATATNGATTGVFLSVNAVAVTSGGSGYTGVTGTFNDAGTNGSGAQAVAYLNLTAVNLTGGGSGYTSRPTIAIAAPGRSCTGGPTPGLTCTANSNCGTGGTCSSSNSSNTATATALMSVDTITLTSGGSGYTSTPTVTIGAPGCTINGTTCIRATATATVSTGSTLTITSLGVQQVPNHLYSGPSATTTPYNQKFISRDYGFGSQCTGHCSAPPSNVCSSNADCASNQTCNPDAGCNALSSVTIGGVPAPVNSWGDGEIQVKVPNVPPCAIQQRGAPQDARCGELVITSGNGKQSVDTVTVTVGGSHPKFIDGETAENDAIQSMIDDPTTKPGDLIIVEPGTYNEMVIMWKPLRLQGVGAASVTINADPQPAGKIDPWRLKVLCLFGLGADGRPDASCPILSDRVPLEGIIGWDTTVNGNLAELLQEPTLMGAYEGAGITVLGKGVDYHGADPYGTGAEAAFPAGTTRLTTSTADCNNYPGNFRCNPSRIDGLTVTNSSQGGGGVFAHGWNHYLEVSNNRIVNNAGTGSGGIAIGQGEFGDPNLAPQDATVVVPPLTTAEFPALNSVPDGTQLPYYLQAHVNVHNNSVIENTSYGDSVYSTTPASAGGVTFTTGSDYYRFDGNFVCGNLSSGDGGGVAHLGFSYNDANGGITRNTILFNQSTNPSIPTHGGGLLVSGAGPDGQAFQCADATGAAGSGITCNPNAPHCPAGETCQQLECGTITDVDCAPGLSEGIGQGLVIDSNLIQGNSAESGSGGGIRLQLVNGAEVSAFPNNPTLSSSNLTPNWYRVVVRNNIIANNVAGWDGGGVSLQDALMVNFVNNTVIDNDATASSGVLFNSFGAPTTSAPPPPPPPVIPLCTTPGCTTSQPQPAGLVTMRNTSNLSSSLPSSVTCPSASQIAGATVASSVNPYSSGNCRTVSLPVLANDVIWQNRSFDIHVVAPTNDASDPQGQQSSVTLVPALNQTSTGDCVATVPAPNTWDIGVRGDTGATNHSSAFTLNPRFSVLTSTAGYSSTNLAANPRVDKFYCNGSRRPPEDPGLGGPTGYLVPPGVAQENIPNPVFSLTPAATVDEANNWINLTYGPLSLENPGGESNGRYIPTSTSPTTNFVTCAAATNGMAPALDIFGNPRRSASCPSSSSTCGGGGTDRCIDAGAVEYPAPAGAFASLSSSSLSFGFVALDAVSPIQNLTVTNSGNIDLTVNTPDFSGATGFVQTAATSGTDCGAGASFTLPAGASCAIGVRFAPSSATGGAIDYDAALMITTTASGDVAQYVGLSGTSIAGTGACSDPTTPDGTVCDDGNACTQDDTCQGGVCVGSNPVLCPAHGQCQVAGVCDPATGACIDQAKPDGTLCLDGTCNDSSPCAFTDTCQGGVCTRVDCAALDQCHDAGTPDPATGHCSNPIKADGVACDDGSACTQADACQAGVCTGGDPVLCVALDQCHQAGICDPGTGACSNQAKPDGSACDDGNWTTCADICSAGACVGTAEAEAVEINDTVALAHDGSGATIGWADPIGQFNVYRGSVSQGQPFSYNQACLTPLGPTSGQSVSDSMSPPVGTVFYYLVTRLNGCLESIPGRDSAGNVIPNNSYCPNQGGAVNIVTVNPPLESGDIAMHTGTLTLGYTGITPFTLTAAPALSKVFGDGTFSVVGGSCAPGLTINPGEKCTINVQYNPSGDSGPSTATASITGTAPGGSDTTLTSESFNAD